MPESKTPIGRRSTSAILGGPLTGTSLSAEDAEDSRMGDDGKSGHQQRDPGASYALPGGRAAPRGGGSEARQSRADPVQDEHHARLAYGRGSLHRRPAPR